MSDYFGFLNLHKPSGVTSHDCISKLRRLLRMKRIGHGGTLDPLAIGVLPIALGSATRLLNYLPTPKTYRATIRLGLTTTTDDLAGDITATAPSAAIEALTTAKINHALGQFQGPLQQIPPAYSAIHVNGQRSYDLARQGEAVALPPRSVEVFRLALLDWQPTTDKLLDLTVEIDCSAGTYIRAIARDLGTALSVGGTLAHLQRTQSCGFQLQDSLTFSHVEHQLQRNQFQPISASDALQHLPVLTLDPDQAQRFCWGQKLPWTSEPPSTPHVRIHQAEGTFLGIGLVGEGLLRAKVVCHPQ